jgi:glycosyltransferase involved in cell wall biosynthesis
VRILYFHQHFSPPRGAAGTRSYEFARRLAEAGHDVTVVCGSSAKCETGLHGPFRRGRRAGEVDGVGVVELDIAYSNHHGFLARSAAFLRYALGGLAIAMRRPCDLVFATATPLTAGIPGIAARWIRRVPFVFEVRDLWPELPREMGVITNPLVLKAMDWLEWSTYHSAHRLVALSPGIAEGIARRGIPEDRIALVPNVCDLDLFDPLGRGASAPSIPGVREGDLVAAFAGAHGIANGLDAVLDAAAVLARRGREDIRLVFVGDGLRKADLVARARREALANCIFLEPLAKRDLAAFMARVDVGLMILADLPAFYRGTSPNKFFDYIAAGLPVLNNYPGWLADLIRTHECGVALPPGDPEVFADALERLADDQVRRASMGAAARRLAESRFARKDLADQFAEALMAGATAGA